MRLDTIGLAPSVKPRSLRPTKAYNSQNIIKFDFVVEVVLSDAKRIINRAPDAMCIGRCYSTPGQIHVFSDALGIDSFSRIPSEMNFTDPLKARQKHPPSVRGLTTNKHGEITMLIAPPSGAMGDIRGGSGDPELTRLSKVK